MGNTDSCAIAPFAAGLAPALAPPASTSPTAASAPTSAPLTYLGRANTSISLSEKAVFGREAACLRKGFASRLACICCNTELLRRGSLPGDVWVPGPFTCGDLRQSIRVT